MSVLHACSGALTSTDEQVPGLLEVLAQVPDPRRRRGGGSAWRSCWPWQ